MNTALLAAAGVALAGIVGVWLRLLVQASRLKSERVLELERPDLSSAPAVTALVPALNEERDIEACLRALLAVDYPNLQILVSDDGSEDATVARVEALAAELPPGKLSVVSTPRDDPRREGWTLGKSFALWIGAEQVTSEWLWFVDADVRVHPDALWRSLEACRLDGVDGFTCGGRYTNPSAFAEALEVMMYTLLFAILPLRGIRDPENREASWLTGQFFLLRRSTYEAIGGHLAVKPYAQDDLALSRVAKRAGYPLAYYPAVGIFDCVNYVSFSEAWHNWVRLCVLGAPWLELGLANFALDAVALLALGSAPPILLGCAWASGAGPLVLGLLGAQVGLTLLLLLSLQASMHKRIWTAFLYPLTATLTALLVLQVISRLNRAVLFHHQALQQDRPHA